MMSQSKSFRSLIAAAALLVATSGIASAAGTDLLRGLTTPDHALPGISGRIDPCGPQKLSGPLGY